MSPIPYKSRLYVPPPIDPEDAGPIATRLDPDDFAIFSSKNESGRYIYKRLVPIVVETGHPLDIPLKKREMRPKCTTVTTKDEDFRGKQVLASWFPYSNDWEAHSVFMGYSKKGRPEKQARLKEIAVQVEAGKTTWAEFFQDPLSIDPFNGSSKSTVAYILNPQRSVDSSSKQVFSQQNRRGTGKGGSKRGKWLAIGICDNIDETVNTILNEPSMQYLLENQDPLFLLRRWNHHEVLHPFRLRDELLDLNYRETILKCAIRKAIAGPVDRQEAFVGKPVATWATSVFLEALYSLNRRYPDGKPDTVIVPDTAPELKSKCRTSPEPSIDFLMMVSTMIRAIGDGKHNDYEKLKKSAVTQLKHLDSNYRLGGLARLSSLSSRIDLDDALKQQLVSMASTDVDLAVREAANSVLKDFADT